MINFRILYILLIVQIFYSINLFALPEPGLIHIDNGTFLLDFVDPVSPQTNEKSVGKRFLTGGWLRRLYLKETKEDIIAYESLHHQGPLYGFPFEFYPSLKLDLTEKRGYETLIQIGVGIVKERGEGRFVTSLIKYFPWTTSLIREGDNINLIFTQKSGIHSGYGYELQVKVQLNMYGNTITYDYELLNTGNKTIQTVMNNHPFFLGNDRYKKAWLKVRPFEKKSIYKMAELTEWAPKANNITEVATGGFLKKDTEIIIKTYSTLDRVLLWKNLNFRTNKKKEIRIRNTAPIHSLESFVNVNVKPKQKCSWQFKITIL